MQNRKWDICGSSTVLNVRFSTSYVLCLMVRADMSESFLGVYSNMAKTYINRGSQL